MFREVEAFNVENMPLNGEKKKKGNMLLRSFVSDLSNLLSDFRSVN